MEQQKAKATVQTFEDLFESFQKAIIEIEKHKETDPEYFEEQLNRLSQQFKKVLGQDRFFAKIHIGIMDFHERAKRRSTRKPLTIRKMKSLNDDLKTLTSILKI